MDVSWVLPFKTMAYFTNYLASVSGDSVTFHNQRIQRTSQRLIYTLLAVYLYENILQHFLEQSDGGVGRDGHAPYLTELDRLTLCDWIGTVFRGQPFYSFFRVTYLMVIYLYVQFYLRTDVRFLALFRHLLYSPSGLIGFEVDLQLRRRILLVIGNVLQVFVAVVGRLNLGPIFVQFTNDVTHRYFTGLFDLRNDGQGLRAA